MSPQALSGGLRRRGFDSGPLLLACAALVAFYATLWLGAWANGGTLFGSHDRANHDFSVFWAAGRLAASGEGAAVYDWDRLRAFQEALLGVPSEEVKNPFFYPPSFLLPLAPLGLLPLTAAAAVWLAATLFAYAAAVQAILPGRTALLAALAAPAVLFNAVSGQNGLLLAALLGGGLCLLEARPLLAGCLIGLMSFKPQFGLLLPFYLAAAGYWRVFASAAATVLGSLAVAVLAFGAGALVAFVGTATGYLGAISAHTPLEWDRLASAYGLMRAYNQGPAAAWAVQLALAGAAAAASLAIARSDAATALKLATVPVAAVLIAPYSELTDLALLTIAMAFLVRDGLDTGLRQRDRAALALAFVLPLVFIMLPPLRRLFGLQFIAVLVGPLDCAVLAAMIGWRLRLRPEAGG